MKVRIEEIKLEKRWKDQETWEEFVQVLLRGEGIMVMYRWPEGLDDPELGEELEVKIGGNWPSDLAGEL